MNEFLTVVRNNYANFKGRARRREYWMFTLVYILISVVVSLISNYFFPHAIPNRPQMNVLGSLLGLILFLPTLAVTIRRMHDTDKSGWWILIGIIPLIGQIILIIFLAQDSQTGSNKWGPNPKGVQAPVNAF